MWFLTIDDDRLAHHLIEKFNSCKILIEAPGVLAAKKQQEERSRQATSNDHVTNLKYIVGKLR